MKYILLILALITIRPILRKAAKMIISKITSFYKKDMLRYGLLSRGFLSEQIDINRFEDWCADLLEAMGYESVEILSENLTGGINICAVKDRQFIYVCTRNDGLNLKELEKLNMGQPYNEDDYTMMDLSDMQSFIGKLAHDKVKSGIVITTGDFSPKAAAYIKGLPGEYHIELIDGVTLTKTWRMVRTRKYGYPFPAKGAQ